MTDFTKVIPPGSEGKITASVNLAHAKGPIEKSVSVTTNDPEHSQFQLKVKANVKSIVDLQPADSIRFTVEKGESRSEELTLVPNYTNPIHLSNPTTEATWVSVSLEPSGPAEDREKQYKLKATLTDSAKVGTQSGTIKITAEGSPEKEISIPVVAVVRGLISINPPTISFVLKNFPDEVAVNRKANLRQIGDVSSNVLLELPAGMTLRVINQTPEWYQVITQGPRGDSESPLANKVGWISKSLVKTSKSSQAPADQSVVLRKENGQTFKVLDYSSTLPQIKVKMDADGVGKEYTFRVYLQDVDKTPKTIPGSIQVKTDDPDQATIAIPVYLIVS